MAKDDTPIRMPSDDDLTDLAPLDAQDTQPVFKNRHERIRGPRTSSSADGVT